MKDNETRYRFAAVALVCAAALIVLGAAGEARADALVSNLGQNHGGHVVGGTALDHAQGFTTGSAAGGYTLSSVELRFASPWPVAAPTVTVHSGTARGTRVASLSGPATVATGVVTFTAPADTALEAGTDYFVKVEGGARAVQFAFTHSTGEDAGGSSGWGIHDSGHYRLAHASGAFETSESVKFLRVNGSNGPVTAVPVPPVDDPPAERAWIAYTGVAGWRVGAQVYAWTNEARPAINRSGLYDWFSVDADGTETKLNAYISQWYLLREEDIGKKVRVEVSFINDDGDRVSLKSPAYPGHGTIVSRTAPRRSGRWVATTVNTAYVFERRDFGTWLDGSHSDNNIYQITSLPSKGALSFNGTAAVKDQRITMADVGAGKLVFTPAANETGQPYTSFNTDITSMTIDVLPEGTQYAVEAPSVEAAPALSDSGDDGEWGPGETVEVTLTFSEPVAVNTTGGTPTVGISLGGTAARRAAYLRGSGTAELVFAYTLSEADGSHTSMVVTHDSLALGGGLIRSVQTAADAALGHNGAAKAALPVQPPPAAAAFTAAFESVPAGHDGSSAFTLEFALSEQPGGLGWRTVRDHLFDVAGGAIERVRRIGTVRNQRWELTVSPDGNEAVTLTLRATASCTAAHAVCTADERTLGGGATATVAAEQPDAAFTGAFANEPGEHDGSSAFTLEFHLSEAPRGLGWRTVKGHLFDVTGGAIERVRRIGTVRNRGWELLARERGDLACRARLLLRHDLLPRPPRRAHPRPPGGDRVGRLYHRGIRGRSRGVPRRPRLRRQGNALRLRAARSAAGAGPGHQGGTDH